MMFPKSLRDELTEAVFDAPRPGDRFHEMYSFWMFVVGVEPNGGRVAVLTASPPCTFPQDGKLEIYSSAQAFRDAWRDTAGYTVTLADRGNCIVGWFQPPVGWDAS